VELHDGATVAGYRIERLIGSGSVYLAQDVALGRRVALKVVPLDAPLRERLLSKTRLVGALEHPHIVPIHAVGESDGLVYVAMRYVDGGDLGALLARGGPLAPERALRIGEQVAAALDAAHAHELVHGNLKPANVLLAHDGEQAYVSDFGCAHGGAVESLAPEQLEGLPVDRRADVYALGCLLFACLTGRAPFARDNELATILAHRSEPPPRAAELRPELPGAVDAVLARALAKDRELRHASCGDLVADARGALEGRAPAAPAPHTFVFADIRGYTSYTREHGDEASARMLRQFAAIVEAAASAHGGTVTQYRGDEALTVFRSPRAALRFGLELQRRVAEERLPCGVGVGVDAGEAVAIGADFHGTALNRAARLCAIARAGEMLASDGVLHLAGNFDDVRFGLRRLERLKGFPHPVGVNEIHAAASAPRRELRRRAARALRGRHPRARLALAGVVLAAAAGAVALAAGGGGHPRALAFQANSIALLNARTGASEGTAAPGLHVCVFATAGRDLWACDADQSIVLRVDARSRRVVDEVPLPTYHGSFTIAFGSIWVGDVASPTIRRVNVQYRTSSPPIRLPGVPAASADGQPENVDGMVATNDALWATYGFPKRIARIDPQSGRVTFSTPLHQDCPCVAALAAGDGQLWVVGGDGLHLFRLDPTTGKTLVSGRLHGGTVTGAAVAGGYLWVTIGEDGGVWKVDQTGAPIDKIATGRGPRSPFAGGGHLWVANADDGTVTRIDPSTNATRTYRVRHRPLAVAEVNGTLFVGLAPGVADAARQIVGKRIVRGDAPDFATSADPTSYDSPADLVVGAADGAGLMSARTRGAGGTTTIVPELAAAPPTISADGRTYTFRLRAGGRFSSGEPVTADAIRSSVERAVSPRLLNHYCRDRVLDDVAGQAAYEAGRAAHISGVRVAGPQISITLARPSASLPARLTNPCLSVVPPSTPRIPVGVNHPIPSAGPYYVASLIPGQQIVLRRNPYYRGPRPARLDTLVLTGGEPPAAAGAAVERGAADFSADPSMPATPDFAPGGGYQRRFSRAGARLRYVLPSSPLTALLLFDTRNGIFRSPSLRRAVNLALDRRALAAKVPGAEPRSSLIPPGIPGHSAKQPYPAPDLRRAVALARDRGGVALMVGLDTSSEPALNTALRRELAGIGVMLRMRTVAQGAFPMSEGPSAGAPTAVRGNGGGPPSGGSRSAVGANPPDLVLVGWAPDYPDPSDVVNVLLDPAVAPPGDLKLFADRYWVKRMRQAASAPPSRRAAVYAKLDSQLALGPSPFAVLGSAPGTPQLISSRLGCVTYDFGRLDLSSLCLK
jgi:ABC-type transport system substrate-binding protein/class 3 adenylate cyclase